MAANRHQLTTFTVERELSTAERAAVWRAVVIDHGAVRPSCRESGQPGNADIYAVWRECVLPRKIKCRVNRSGILLTPDCSWALHRLVCGAIDILYRVTFLHARLSLLLLARFASYTLSDRFNGFQLSLGARGRGRSSSMTRAFSKPSDVATDFKAATDASWALPARQESLCDPHGLRT